MQRQLLAIALTWATAVTGGAILPSVVPQPTSIVTGGQDVALSPSFKFEVAARDAAVSKVLEAAMERFRVLLLPSASVTSGGGATHADLQLQLLPSCTVDVPASASLQLSSTTNESYTLTIDGGANSTYCAIVAASAFGAMHGMETLVQLVDRARRTVPSEVHVVDAPRFAFRATMVDCARRYIPVRVLEQHVDAMSATKMNVLHLHLVDSQSFPYESATFPALSKHGAYSAAEVYTQQDIAGLVRYAYARGVRVMPEIDTPGHVWAGLEALDPAVLSTCYGKSGGAAGTGPLDPSKESTFAFLRDLLAEVVPLFSGGEDSLAQPSFMMGGDEVPTDCWASNKDIVAFAEAKNLTVGTLARYFAQRLLSILQAQGGRNRSGGSTSTSTSASTPHQLMLWQEVFESGTALPAAALVNVWSGGWLWCSKQTSGSSVNRTADCSADYDKGGPNEWFGKMHVRDDGPWKATMAKVAAAGHRSVLSSPFYMNAGNAGSNFDEAWPWYYSVEPTDFPAGGVGSRATGRRPLTAREREASVAGVEACMWSSWVDGSNLMARFWPSAAAVAERGWSAKGTASIDDFRRRLHALSCRLLARGLPASPPTFGGAFFFENGTVCPNMVDGVSVMGPGSPGCLPRFSHC